jgi:hypothetical protein
VTYEAQGSGCALVVSDATGALADDGKQALIHPAGDIAVLTAGLRRLVEEPELLSHLQAASLEHRPELTWSRAGRRLAEAHGEAAARYRAS